ncbi:MAG TPA: ATP-binding protein [Gemmatimonadaceae bacterium]|nr:ATP-binding protein [Gemmatimonadaceae bacterium]
MTSSPPLDPVSDVRVIAADRHGQRLFQALADARRHNGRIGDRWMLRLIIAGITGLLLFAATGRGLSAAVWVLLSTGAVIAGTARGLWPRTRHGAITLGIAAHLVGWPISVQIGGRVEWGAIFFVITTIQLRYEDWKSILPSIAFYILQHVAQYALLTSGVSLDFIWVGSFNATGSALATVLAVVQGFVIVEIARALCNRNESSILANIEMEERAAQADAQSAALQRTEAIMKGVLGGCEDGFAVFDTDLRVLVWNTRMESITGVPSADAIGRLRSDILTPEPARMAALESAIAGVPAHLSNVAFVDANTQAQRILDVAYLPLRDADGHVIGAFKVAHDVSDQLRAAEAVSAMRQQLLEALEAIDAGFALFDAEDRVIQVNSAYRAYYKEIADKFEPGTPYVEIARAYLTAFPEYAGGLPLDEAVRSWVLARSERANTKEFQQADRWLLLQDRPTASGGRVSLRTDISHLKHIQRELEEARSKAEQANRAKSEFLARMSHELRTPLNSIIGFSRLVKSNKQGTLSAKDVNFLNRVSINGEHLLTLINDILDLSRIEAGRMPVLVEEIDCNALILDTVRMLEGQASHEEVRLVPCISPYQLNVSTDSAKLRQVLINLVGNAVKFTARGTVTVRVDKSEEVKDGVVFSVIDTGVGIPAERQQAIFDAFEQADGTTTRQYGGTGLGLTISRSLCELINATLTVESEVGVGSIFRVTCAPMLRRATGTSMRAVPAPQVTASATAA